MCYSLKQVDGKIRDEASMHTRKKSSSGFFIVEILIVLAIVAILVVALLPNLSLYTSRTKFADVMRTANAVKPSVELCILVNATSSTIPSTCSGGTNGVPANTTAGYATNVSGFSTSSGIITATGNGSSLTGRTYILTPTINATGAISWTSSGTCKANGLCQ